MSEDKNTKQESEITTTEVAEQARPRGSRGELGEATASLTLKQRYHQSHFKRVDPEDKYNPNKRIWVKNEDAPSLKQFARKLLASGDISAKEWFANKNGAKNVSRSEANIKAAMEASNATKTERRKKSQGKK